MDMNLGLIVQVMDDEDLAKLAEANKGREDVRLAIETELFTRLTAREFEARKAEFEAKVTELAGLPEPPAGIHNVFMSYKGVEVPIGEAVEVKVKGQDGKMVTEMRQPTETRRQWVVEVNHADRVGAVKVTDKAAKREIRVLKRDGMSLKEIGIFANATKACDHLKLEIGGDSANRVLSRNGYITEYTADTPVPTQAVVT